MINLIPPSAHSQVQREYWIRVVSVWMFLTGCALCIAAILYAPVYVLVEAELGNYLLAYNQASDDSETYTESEKAIQSGNAIAQLLATSDTDTSFSEIIAEIEKQKIQGIRVDDYSIARKDGILGAITIKGNADSRLILTQFKDAIEKSPLFESATLPLSNLAKDRDIPFTVTIIPTAVAPQ